MTYLPHWPIPSTLGNASIDRETVFLRTQKVLQKLGNPHHKLPPTIHLTGTNGKGSTATFLTEIFRQSNYKADLYTSPHLHNCNERIKIDGLDICDRQLHQILEETRIAAADTPLSFFEGFTVAAFLAFSRSKSDILILESGMGARADITNIIEQKSATIITPISFDHQEFLGDSIAKIAFEKSFIINENTPLIIGPQPKEASQIIEIIAKDKNAPISRYGHEFSIKKTENEQNFDLKINEKELKNLPKPTLRGDHQYINAATAISCALSLKNFKISESSIKKALKTAKIANRLEKIDHFNKFFERNTEIYIDSAHNVGGAYSLANWLGEQKEEKYLILGFTKDKCQANFLKILKTQATEIIAVRVNGEPNPESAEKIQEIGRKNQIEITKQDDLFDAINYLSQKITAPATIVIAGSMHLARDVRKYSSA